MKAEIKELLEKSVECFDKALDSNPENRFTLRNYAVALQDLESIELESKLGRRVYEGDFTKFSSRIQKAEQAFLRSLELDEKDANTLNRCPTIK